MQLPIDHLVIGATSLAQGASWAKRDLGVDIPAGGSHPGMGTHNLLTATGADIYLEIIATNPESVPPDRPRLFNLDDPARKAALAAAPGSLTWVARSPDIEATYRAARDSGVDLGRIVAMSRGDLNWRLTVRDDGTLPEEGVIPTIIQWPDGPHPARRMRDLGLRIETLTLTHPDPDRVKSLLLAMGVALEPPLTLERGDTARVSAVVSASDGRRVTI